MIGHRGLRRFVIFPLLINILVFTMGVWLGIGQFQNLLEWMLPKGDAWWIEFVRIALWTVFSAVSLLLVFFTFTLAANLIGSPFNGLLSEKVERYLGGRAGEGSEGVRALIMAFPSSIKSEVRKFSYFFVAGAVVFIVTLVPGVNVLSPILWGIFASWMLALEYIAYPMENHNMYFSRVRAGLKKQRAITFGFGVAVMLITSIPLVNFLVMPAAVSGATAMWVESLRHKDELNMENRQ
jgi:CysZ protein